MRSRALTSILQVNVPGTAAAKIAKSVWLIQKAPLSVCRADNWHHSMASQIEVTLMLNYYKSPNQVLSLGNICQNDHMTN